MGGLESGECGCAVRRLGKRGEELVLEGGRKTGDRRKENAQNRRENSNDHF